MHREGCVPTIFYIEDIILYFLFLQIRQKERD